MKGFTINVEVSLKDCFQFQFFIQDARLDEVYNFHYEQISSDLFAFHSEECLEDYEIQDLCNEMEEICNDFEVEIYYDINY